MADLFRAIVENAKVQAYRHPIVEEMGFNGGPILPDTPDFHKLRHHRWGAVKDSARPDENYNTLITGEVGYAGPIISHYGHMVAEGVHRIVPARHFYGVDRFLFVSVAGDQSLNEYSKLPSYIKDMLRFLNLYEDNIIIINQNTTFERLMVVEQGCSIGSKTNDQYLDIMREFSQRKLQQLHSEKMPSKKVYVCGKKEPGGSILGETYLQALLEKSGFWIFRPEDHSFSFQLYVYSQAEILIFSEGSAIHTASVLGRDALNDVAILVRRPRQADTFYNGLLGRCKSLQTAFCTSYLGTVVSAKKTGAPVVHLGVSVYNIGALRHFFITQGVHSFFGFDRKAYFEQCENDLLEYLRHCLNADWTRMGTAAYAEILAHFELCKNNDIN